MKAGPDRPANLDWENAVELYLRPLHSPPRVSGSLGPHLRDRLPPQSRQAWNRREAVLSDAEDWRLQRLDGKDRRPGPKGMVDLFRYRSGDGHRPPHLRNLQLHPQRGQPVQPCLPSWTRAAHHSSSRLDDKLGDLPLHTDLDCRPANPT